jgi:GT2 family glycosyltransferase
MWDAGWRVRYVPEARVEHVGGVSAATGPADLYFLRSLFAYLRKVHGRWAGGMLVAALRLGMFLREGLLLVAEGAAALALRLAGRPTRARRRLRRARQAARFLLRDGWLTFLRP